MRDTCKMACVVAAFTAVVSSASVLRGSVREEFASVAKNDRNGDIVFQHFGPPAYWGAVERPDSSANLCMDQRLVPELYVLGSPKAATTSFWMHSQKAGIAMPLRGLYMGKEFRFFVGRNLSEDVADMKPGWLESMPTCPTQSRKIVGDFNPHNLAAVRHAYNPHAKKVGPGLPVVLKALYSESHVPRLRFMVMLREPLSRMQSHWHMNKIDFPFVDHGAKTFNDSMAMLQTVLRTHHNAGKTREWGWLWASLYGFSLPAWLEQFAADQFFIIPMKEYTQGNAQAICMEIATRMNFDIECVGKHMIQLKRTTSTRHAHGDVTDELGKDLIEFFQTEVLATSNSELVGALAKADAAGAYLANYDGPAGNVAAIRTWLQQGW